MESIHWCATCGNHYLVLTPECPRCDQVPPASVPPLARIEYESWPGAGLDEGWVQQRADGSVWVYDAAGRLLEVTPKLIQPERRRCELGHHYLAVGDPPCPVCAAAEKPVPALTPRLGRRPTSKVRVLGWVLGLGFSIAAVVGASALSGPRMSQIPPESTTSGRVATALPPTEPSPLTTQSQPTSTADVSLTTSTAHAVGRAVEPSNVHVAATQLCVLGWSNGTDWVAGFDVSDTAPPVDQGTGYYAVSLTDISQVNGGSPIKGVEPMEPPWRMEFLPSLSAVGAGVAISGLLEPVPHFVQPISGNSDDYRETVTAKLALYGLTNVPIEITQAVRTDIQGDGVNEVIFVAQHPGADEFLREPGVFSMVILR